MTLKIIYLEKVKLYIPSPGISNKRCEFKNNFVNLGNFFLNVD